MPRTDARGGPQTRARILEAATRLFLERGYDAVPVAEIAREAGVSSVTVFNHFPRKEDLFLDRAADVEDILRDAVHDRPPELDTLASLCATALGLFDERHPLSGLDERSVPFFRIVATSPALLARARQISADLQRFLETELDREPTFRGDSSLLAAFFIAGYSSVLVETARRRISGESGDTVADDHRDRLVRMFDALRDGVRL